MLFILEAFFSGCISKVINDGKDYSWSKIKSVIKDRHDQNISTKKCRLIEKSLNIVTDNAYKNSDDLYNAIEKIFSEFKNHGDTFESVKNGLGVLGADASDQKCENFLEEFYQGIRLDDDLYKAVMLDMQQKDIQFSQEELQKLNEKIDRNHKELVEKLDGINQNLSGSSLDNGENIAAKKSKFQNNKKEDYLRIWNSRLFLHLDNDERPITLADAFIMPDYQIYKKNNRIGYTDNDLLENVIDKFVKYKRTSTMLITGVPGIGKSTITSWIANKYKDDEKCIILRFRDWEGAELKKGLLKSICMTLECKTKELEGKVLILDGFDEMKLLNIREKILDDFAYDVKDFENLKIIITSRPSYISSLNFDNNFKLCPFDSHQIKMFYKKITNTEIRGYVDYNNIDVFGIPVILYMAIMSNINITKSTTKPQLYNRIFAEKGGIFDRFYDGEVEYDKGSQIFRNSKNIKEYLSFLRKIAFMMFEKNSLLLEINNCDIPILESGEDSVSILEFPIKHLFDNTEFNIEFIHKSIYEFFASEYVFEVVYKSINMSDNELIGAVGEVLEAGILSEEIIEFLKYKFTNSKLMDEFEHLKQIFKKMIENGMTYYTDRRLNSVIDCEINVFSNMLHILHFWKFESLHLSSSIIRYYLQGNGIIYNLNKISLMRSDLRGTNLIKANLRETNLRKTNLRGADLSNADLRKANLSGADLRRADLKGADLEASIWYESDIQKALSQLKTANFTYLMIREDNGVKMVQRSELFPDENKL